MILLVLQLLHLQIFLKVLLYPICFLFLLILLRFWSLHPFLSSLSQQFFLLIKIYIIEAQRLQKTKVFIKQYNTDQFKYFKYKNILFY